mmetsp:Transcript_13800/g.32209  ORF Transcript_13800/g.32209 Transcript_13800/m.32209 type:complete len:217 (+) Transcript_13800:544-1194(+)
MEGPLRRKRPGRRQGSDTGRDTGGPSPRGGQQVRPPGRCPGSLPAGAGRSFGRHGGARDLFLQGTGVRAGRILCQQRVPRPQRATSPSAGSGGRRISDRRPAGTSPDPQSRSAGAHPAADPSRQASRDEVSDFLGRRGTRRRDERRRQQQRLGSSLQQRRGGRHFGRPRVGHDDGGGLDGDRRDGHATRQPVPQPPARRERHGRRGHHGRGRAERR